MIEHLIYLYYAPIVVAVVGVALTFLVCELYTWEDYRRTMNDGLTTKEIFAKAAKHPVVKFKN